ncbi:hypothetical protein K4K61_007499 [Colletotrichum sp. SAR11_59]|nr:hypothetical protein K4K61_007499 [Colletotrichum sp. SAR11_59]
MIFDNSSYMQYKHHTDVGFRWLYETAMKHRWRPNEAPKVADYTYGDGPWLSADANLDEASTDVDQRNWQELKTGSDDELAEDLHYVPVEDDFLLDLFCLFKDAKNIREYLQGVWQRYREREIDVISAALITQMAFATVEDLEAGFVRRHDNLQYIGQQIGAVHANAALGVSGLWVGPWAHWEANFDDIKCQMEASEWKQSKEIEEETFRPTSIMLEMLAILAEETPIVKDDGELLSLLTPAHANCLQDLRRLIVFYNEIQTGASTDFDFLAKRLRKRPEPQRILLSTAFMCRVFLDIPEDVKVSDQERTAFDEYIKS